MLTLPKSTSYQKLQFLMNFVINSYYFFNNFSFLCLEGQQTTLN